jgi:hypothetical protein
MVNGVGGEVAMLGDENCTNDSRGSSVLPQSGLLASAKAGLRPRAATAKARRQSEGVIEWLPLCRCANRSSSAID